MKPSSCKDNSDVKTLNTLSILRFSHQHVETCSHLSADMAITLVYHGLKNGQRRNKVIFFREGNVLSWFFKMTVMYCPFRVHSSFIVPYCCWFSIIRLYCALGRRSARKWQNSDNDSHYCPCLVLALPLNFLFLLPSLLPLAHQLAHSSVLLLDFIKPGGGIFHISLLYPSPPSHSFFHSSFSFFNNSLSALWPLIKMNSLHCRLLASSLFLSLCVSLYLSSLHLVLCTLLTLLLQSHPLFSVFSPFVSAWCPFSPTIPVFTLSLSACPL